MSSDNSSYDVMIIGGGPGASAAAIACARVGLRTAMVFREPPAAELAPRESLPPSAVVLLEELGALSALKAASRATYSAVWRGEHRTGIGGTSGLVGHHVDRRALDRDLRERAREAGAEVLPDGVETLLGDRALVLASGRKVSARYLIDGSGNTRLLGRRLKLKEQFFSEPMVARAGLVNGLSAAQSGDGCPSFIVDRPGWTWLAPEPGGLCSWTSVRQRSASQVTVHARLVGTHALATRRAANVRWRIFRPLVEEGCLLVGDAAGLLDPATGQGVFLALWSGLMAARAVAASLHRPDLARLLLARYDGWFVEQYQQRVRELDSHYEALAVFHRG